MICFPNASGDLVMYQTETINGVLYVIFEPSTEPSLAREPLRAWLASPREPARALIRAEPSRLFGSFPALPTRQPTGPPS